MIRCYLHNMWLMLPSKIGIRIPSHNSLTVSFFDELLQTAVTSRKIADAKKIRLRLSEKYHIAIVSTGLSYLAYLGALKKVQKGYQPTRFGKKIGKLLVQERIEEANIVWSELLKRHKLFRVFSKFLSKKDDNSGTLEDFSVYIRKRAHAKWKISAIRSRVSRVCELFAEKGLIEYQNGILSIPDSEEGEGSISIESTQISESKIRLPVDTSEKEKTEELQTEVIQSNKLSALIGANSWPIKIEITMNISDRAPREVINLIFAHIKELQRTVRPTLDSDKEKVSNAHSVMIIQHSEKKKGE